MGGHALGRPDAAAAGVRAVRDVRAAVGSIPLGDGRRRAAAVVGGVGRCRPRPRACCADRCSRSGRTRSFTCCSRRPSPCATRCRRCRRWPGSPRAAIALARRVSRRWSRSPVVGRGADRVPCRRASRTAREPHPAFRAIAAMRPRRADRAAGRDVHAHYALRRPLQAADRHRCRIVEPRRQYEWLGPVDYWRGGGTRAGLVSGRSAPHRSGADRSAEPARRRPAIRWAVADRPELSGTRPLGADWYRLRPPGWFAGEGWSLTPETGGHRAGARRPGPITARSRPGCGGARPDAPPHRRTPSRRRRAIRRRSSSCRSTAPRRDRWTLTRRRARTSCASSTCRQGCRREPGYAHA